LKGRGFSRAASAFLKIGALAPEVTASSPHPILGGAALHNLRKKSVLRLILGGAAVRRCDKPLTFISGFSRRGHRFDFFRSLFSAAVIA
jgi:hypothetical protein